MNKSSRKSSAAKARAAFTAAVTAVGSIWSLSPAVSNAGTSTNTAGPVQQGQSDGGTGNPSLNNPAVTITFAGQTALKNFIISPDITLLQPGTSIILHDGTNAAPILYTATNDSSTSMQLANKTFTQADRNPGTPTSPSTADLQIASGIRTEWHEEGSVDGFYDLVNDQIGFNQSTGPISNESLRAPSTPNPTIINQVTFNTSGNVTTNGFTLNYNASAPLSNTYNTALYNQATGTNIQGGQNRVQFSIGEYPTEALAVSGTASPLLSGSASSGYSVGTAGYGLGNTALKQASLLTSLGTSGARQQFQPVSAANEATNIVNPNTDTNYTTGPWNTAGANNITSTAFAATAVTYTANPGTGLQRIDLGDSQWLQTTGRLQNGALFNVVARTIDTGQRVVFADNTGVDPSWAVGSNDDGNSTTSSAATAQHSIGPSLRFDGKTSGSEAETTISASRMAVGALSVPEATAASSSAPVRALDVDFTNQVDVNPANDTGGPDGTGSFVRANFDTIVSDGINPINDGSSFPAGTVVPHYAATLISHFNTVKNPSVTALQAYEAANPNTQNLSAAAYNASSWAALSSFDPSEATYNGSNGTSLDQPAFPVTGIKGDSTGDVGAFLSNIVASNGTAAKGITTASANDPADGLFATGYLIPGLLNYTRQADGNAVTPVTLSSAALAEQAQVNANYGYLFTTDGTFAANSETIGSASYYGGGNGLSSNGVAINGAIPITAKDSSGNLQGDGTLEPAGNYLFGNFNQNGVRDLSAVEQGVNAALSLYAVDGAKNSIFTSDGGVPNSTVIPSLVGTPGWVTTGTDTKGDLIVLGDYNGDGKFDGSDLYLLAIGASLTSANSSTGLNATYQTFSDVVRDPTDVLRKNAALNYINSYLNTTSFSAGALFLRKTGAAVLTETGVTTAAGVPRGATALNTTDPITGLEQFSYDPNGTNAFNPNDVNRDGVVDFNDAVLVDQYNGQSYENLTQSLAATQQTPVTGTVEPLNLVAVQQVDGEAAIGSADLAVINTGLTGVGSTNWYAYTLNKSGPGNITWNRTGGTVTLYSGAGLQISSGTVHVLSAIDPFTDSTATGTQTSLSLPITVSSGGTLEYTAGSTTGIQLDRLSNLNISTGGQVLLDPAFNHANRTLLLVGGLTVNGNLDLGNNDLDVQGGSLSALQSAVAEGYNGGAWNGSSGITSISAANDTTHLTTLAIVQNNQSGSALFTASNPFDGITPGASDILVKYTYYGDTNLDGKVDGTDYSRIDNGSLNHLTGWTNGDFNYDGVINGSDYTLIDNAYNTQGASLAGQIAGLPSAIPTSEISSSSVPEPTVVGLLGFGSVALLGRRRRQHQ